MVFGVLIHPRRKVHGARLNVSCSIRPMQRRFQVFRLQKLLELQIRDPSRQWPVTSRLQHFAAVPTSQQMCTTSQTHRHLDDFNHVARTRDLEARL